MTFCVAVAAGVVGALEVVCCGVDTDVALYFIPALGDWETGTGRGREDVNLSVTSTTESPPGKTHFSPIFTFHLAYEIPKVNQVGGQL